MSKNSAKPSQKPPAAPHDDAGLVELGKRTLQIEGRALQELEQNINQDFAKACRLMLACEGRVVVIGIGKSGHIARKIAATLASTGTPAFFVHSAEAGHGDMGMLTKQDVVLMISYSGASPEVVQLISPVKRLGLPIIAMTGDAKSYLAKEADVHLSVKVGEEACPLGLAPTSSTTVTLALGDALAVALLTERGFTADEFALSHPSGSLGKKLQRISDIMHRGKDIPMVAEDVKVADALLEITSKKLGMTTVVGKQGELVGVFTDGDLRRCLDRKIDVRTAEISSVMTRKFTTIAADSLVGAALGIMEQNKINALPVVDEQGALVGAINMHDLLQVRAI